MYGFGDSAPAGVESQAFARLQAAIERSVARIRDLDAELLRARRRIEELDRALADGSGAAPSALVDRLHALEQQNRDLLRRLEDGREGVRRLLAKIRFLEEQR